MVLAGEIATPPYSTSTTATSSTSTFTTTETLTDTITASLVNGHTYEVSHSAIWNSSVAGDDVSVRLREDSVTGTAMNGFDVRCASSTRYYGVWVRARYTASVTGSKTFIVSGQRMSGTGNIIRAASSANPSLLTVTEVL